jgi:Ca2+/H+ antiporter
MTAVGNAAEHASAIVFAYKNRIEIALGVAVGEFYAGCNPILRLQDLQSDFAIL